MKKLKKRNIMEISSDDEKEKNRKKYPQPTWKRELLGRNL